MSSKKAMKTIGTTIVRSVMGTTSTMSTLSTMSTMSTLSTMSNIQYTTNIARCTADVKLRYIEHEMITQNEATSNCMRNDYLHSHLNQT